MLALLAAAVLGISVTAPAAAPAAAAPAASATHTVESGDTLSDIAETYGVSLHGLYELNGLGPDSVIRPGDRILLSEDGGEGEPPAEEDSGQGTAGETHTVRSGDTLSEIAYEHGVSLSTVLELNGLDRSSTIYPGDVIVLSSGGSGGSGHSHGDRLLTGPNDTGRVILTFDDCPRSLDSFAEVVSFADANEIGLVIAPTGDCIRSFESRYGKDIAALARANGQYVINHSISHRDLTTLSCDDAAEELGAPGVVTNFGRPPYGALNSGARCGYARVGMSPWLWGVDTRDWTGKSEGEVVSSVVEKAEPGSTVLMHMQWNGFSPSAISQMRDGLSARGLELCRDHSGTTPVELPDSLPC